jgi:regulator of sirC expression with transglutaminase-like and TPR domain
MLGERERGRMESIHRMAILAAVLVRRPLELASMCVLVARRTSLELQSVQGGFACGHVALRTQHVDVLAL